MTPTGGVSTHDKFRIAAKRSEVLFADFILEHLNANGRAGFIVPEGIIFQNNDDYVSLRKWLIKEAGLWAVVSLPGNIFQPYSGVKTSVLFVDRALARQRDDILLVKVENDGFSLNTNRTPISQNDLPAALELLKAAKQPNVVSANGILTSSIAHRVVPRADFAKLDAYKAASTAWAFCRKFLVRAERLKTTVAEASAAGNHKEMEKAQKALDKVPAELYIATGLHKLPSSETQLRAAFDEAIKGDAVKYGDNPADSGKLTEDLRGILDKERDFNLSFDQSSYSAAPTSHYPTEQLGELATVVRGSSPRPKLDSRYYGGSVPRLMVSDLTRDGMYVTPRTDTLTEEGAKQSRWMKKGDVVLAVSGNPGLPAILAVDACIHDGFVGLRELNTKRLLPEFLYHALFFLKVHTSGQAVGSIFKNLTTEQVGAFKIPVPPINEQRAIVSEIESYKRVVDGCAAVIDHYRPCITPGPEWPSDSLGHHFNRVTELCDPQATKEETINYIGLENLESQTGRLVGEIRHSPKSIKSTKVIFRPGDILYGKLRPSLNKVWLADRNGICSTDILVLRAKRREVIAAFYTAYFRQKEFNARVIAGVEGAQLPRVNFDHMAGLEIPIPPVEEQEAIVSSIDREQMTLSGLHELKAKYAAKIAARLASVWGETL